MHWLDNKVFDIIDARCNHEVHCFVLFMMITGAGIKWGKGEMLIKT